MTGTNDVSSLTPTEPVDGPERRRSLVGLQVLRAVAAISVVVNHAVSEASSRDVIKTDIDFDFGGFGVDIFFVISGFIMVYSNVGAFGRTSSVSSFLIRRIIRIVPLYWLVSTIFLVTLQAVREDPGLSLHYIIASYLFIPFPEPQDGADFPFYFLGWTLEFEMFFYLFFSVSLMWRRSVGVASLCGFMVAYMTLGSVVHFPPPFDYWVSSQLLEFVAGCLLAEAYLRGLRFGARTCRSLTLGAILAVFVTWYYLGGWPDGRGVVWGLPAMALVGAATLRPARAAYRVEAILARIGDASYSLYLVHSLVFVVVYHLARHSFRHWDRVPPAAYVGLLLLSASGVAFIGFWGVERPMTSMLQRLLLRHHSRA